MAGFFLIGAMAAFGLFCVIWVLFGWLIFGDVGGAVVCLCHPGLREEPLVYRYCWLRGMGLVRAPLLAVDCGLSDSERAWLQGCRGVELCSLEDLPSRLELERNRIDGTGT